MPLPFHRSLAVSLALCAMLLRALLPVGWMPNSGPDAAVSPFVICSIDGHHSGKTGNSKDGERRHGPCAFAAAGHLAPPTLATAALGTTGESMRLAPVFANDGIAAATPYRPNAARAPPAFI